MASRETTAPNATASTAARMSARVRSAGITRWRTSPDRALRADEPCRGETVRAAGHVFAREAHVLALGHGHAELPRTRLDAPRRAERRDFDLELTHEDGDARAFRAERVELIREVDLLHAQADEDEQADHEHGGAQQRRGERAPQLR